MWPVFLWVLIVEAAWGARGAGGVAGAGGSTALDINELFPGFREPAPAPESGADYTNISLDIQKLDIEKLRRRMRDDMRPRLHRIERAPPGAAAVAGVGARAGAPPGAGVEAGAGRRMAVVWYPNTGITFYREGYNLMLFTLQCDMILQLIYMAKGQVSIVENNPNVNTADTGYRAGFMGHKCRRIFLKIGRVLNFMQRWQFAIFDSSSHVVLHHRSVRLHIDFLHYYWVLNNLDALYRERFEEKYRPRLPQGDENTGGISLEAAA